MMGLGWIGAGFSYTREGNPGLGQICMNLSFPRMAWAELMESSSERANRAGYEVMMSEQKFKNP